MQASSLGHLCAASTLALSILFLSVSAIPNAVHATSIIELSASNGSMFCPTYLTGPGVSSTAWNASSATCTVVAQPNVTPTLCISSSSTGCSGAAIDKLVIDLGVTLLMERKSGTDLLSILCVYSTLENHGTIEGGSICDYGTITNFGTIDVPLNNDFQIFPFNKQGILDNMVGGVLVNHYRMIDWGTIVNNGTIFNKGVFGDDNQNYNETFTNNGSYVGSAPCFTTGNCRTILGIYNITSSGTTIDNTLSTGVALTIKGTNATNVSVVTQNQTTATPVGLGALNVSSPIFYDVMISGVSEGTARVCVTTSDVTQSMDGGMQYWDGITWAYASDQTVTPSAVNLNQTIPGDTVTFLSLCGNIPISALTGTPIGAGTPTSSTPHSSTPPSSNSPTLKPTSNNSCDPLNLSCSRILQGSVGALVAVALAFTAFSIRRGPNKPKAILDKALN